MYKKKILYAVKNTPKIIKRYGPLMKNGKYKWNYTLSYIYRDSDDCGYLSGITDIVLSHSTHVKKFICYFINLIRPVKNRKHDKKNKYGICADVLMLSCVHNDVKLFDSRNKLVFSEYFDINRLNNILDGRRHLGAYLPIVDMLYCDGNIIIERMVLDTPASQDSKSKFLFFLNLYKEMYKHLSAKSIPLSVVSPVNTEGGVEAYRNCIIAKEIYVCPQHGDFWRGNILYEDGKYYVIDLEKFGNHYFLGDLLYYLLAECIVYSDYEGIDLFFKGEYDEEFDHFFEALGIARETNREIFAEFVAYMWYFKWNRENNYPDKILGDIYEKYYI